MTDLDHKKKKLEKLTAGNERSFGELRQATSGQFTMDTVGPRLEMLIDLLRKAEVLTEEQVLDLELEFHEKVEEALGQAWGQFRASQVQSQKQGPRLVVPGGRGEKKLINPNTGKPL